MPSSTTHPNNPLVVSVSLLLLLYTKLRTMATTQNKFELNLSCWEVEIGLVLVLWIHLVASTKFAMVGKEAWWQTVVVVSHKKLLRLTTKMWNKNDKDKRPSLHDFIALFILIADINAPRPRNQLDHVQICCSTTKTGNFFQACNFHYNYNVLAPWLSLLTNDNISLHDRAVREILSLSFCITSWYLNLAGFFCNKKK